MVRAPAGKRRSCDSAAQAPRSVFAEAEAKKEAGGQVSTNVTAASKRSSRSAIPGVA